MPKKCVVVSHSTRNYKLQFRDLTKIIFREKRNIPHIPSFHSHPSFQGHPTFHSQPKNIDFCCEVETEAGLLVKDGQI
jgi:hypothetical protein